MNKVTKILITIGIAIVFIFISSLLNIKYNSGSTMRTFLGTIIMYFLTRVIWKVPSKNNNNDKQPLDGIN
jgi:hypothetical protein